MKIRMLRLASNFYKDQTQYPPSPSPIGDIQQALGKYCCIGYFDALDIQPIPLKENSKRSIRRELSNVAIKGLDGSYNRKNIICITDQDKKDLEFWEEAEKNPFLFVSMIRTTQDESTEKPNAKSIHEIIDGINQKAHSIAYYTYDHSEIVVFISGVSYLSNLQRILAYYNTINVFKMYTIAAVQEKDLETCTSFDEEIVKCILRATVKNMPEAQKFLAEFKNFLSPYVLQCYDTLGDSDLLIEIPSINIAKLLSCYKMGNLLTHTNPFYMKAFFNIETQIFSVAEKFFTEQ